MLSEDTDACKSFFEGEGEIHYTYLCIIHLSKYISISIGLEFFPFGVQSAKLPALSPYRPYMKEIVYTLSDRQKAMLLFFVSTSSKGIPH